MGNRSRSIIIEFGWTFFVLAIAAMVGIWIVHKPQNRSVSQNATTMASIDKQSQKEKIENEPNNQSSNSQSTKDTDADTDMHNHGAYTENDLVVQATKENLKAFKEEHNKKVYREDLDSSAKSQQNSDSFIENALSLYERLSDIK